MPVRILKALQVSLEMVAAMPAHSLVYHLLHGIPVWAEVGLAIAAFVLLHAVITARNRNGHQFERKPREVLLIEPRGKVKKLVVEDNDIVVVKSPAKARKPRVNTKQN